MSQTLTGQDTIIINNRILSDLANADAATLDFPTDLATVTTGKNGNTIYALNESGKQADVVLRVLRGSEDDKFLNSLLVQMLANFAGFVLMTGEFTKKLGDGKGSILKDTYILSGGVISKGVAAKTNTEGDAEQGISIYNLKFSYTPRALT